MQQLPGGWQKQNALTQEAVTPQEKMMVDVSSPDVIFKFLQSVSCDMILFIYSLTDDKI